MPSANEGHQKIALIVASGSFPSDSRFYPSRLAGPKIDAMLMAETLVWRFGFSPNQIRIVGLSGFAEPTYPSEGFQFIPIATKSAISNGINWLEKSSRRGDVVFFYYSGHGVRVLNPDPKDPETDLEALVPYDAHVGPDHFYYSRELVAKMNSMRGRSKTLMIDACFGGGMDRSFELDGDEFGGHIVSRSLPESDRSSKPNITAPVLANATLLAACDRNQRACEKVFPSRTSISTLGNQATSDASRATSIAIGEFTWAFYRYVWTHPGPLSIREIGNGTKERVVHRRFNQVPQITAYGSVNPMLFDGATASKTLFLPSIRYGKSNGLECGLGKLGGISAGSEWSIPNGPSFRFTGTDLFKSYAKGLAWKDPIVPVLSISGRKN
jgi:Caspase domain